jgi:hypothetical protein
LADDDPKPIPQKQDTPKVDVVKAVEKGVIQATNLDFGKGSLNEAKKDVAAGDYVKGGIDTVNAAGEYLIDKTLSPAIGVYKAIEKAHEAIVEKLPTTVGVPSLPPPNFNGNEEPPKPSTTWGKIKLVAIQLLNLLTQSPD